MAEPPKRFTFLDLGIVAGTRRMEYRRRKGENKSAIHWGQRKLHLSEVEFLSIYWDMNKIPKLTLVYAGAAGGTHIEMLSKMFPTIMFELYDPSKFDVKETDRIKIFNTYFTDEVAASYAGRNDVFFVSDIRTVDYKRIRYDELAARGITQYDDKEEPIGDYKIIKQAYAAADIKVDEGIVNDMDMQQRWVEIMNPMESLLKWHLEYPKDGKPKMYQGLKGTLYWQVFPGATSTETRLRIPHSPTGVFEKGEWEIVEYEEWCFYHNAVVREDVQYFNIFTGTTEPIDYPELLNDFDSTAEAYIWKLYLEKFGVNDIAKQYELTKKLSRELTTLLNKHAAEGKKLTLADRRAGNKRILTRLPSDVFAKKKQGSANKPNKPNKPNKSNKPVSPRVNPKSPTVAPRPTATAPIVLAAPTVAPPTVGPKSPGTIVPVKMITPVVVAPPTVGPKSPGTIVPVKMITPVVVAPPTVGPKSPGTIVPVKMVTPVVVAPPTVGPKSPGTIVPVKMVAPVVVAPPTVGPKSPGTIVPVKMVAPVVVAPPTVVASVVVAPPTVVTAKSPVTVVPVKIVTPTVGPVTVAKSPIAPIVVTQPKTAAVVVTAPKPVVAPATVVAITPKKATVVVNIPKTTAPKVVVAINK